jgi:regulatory protein
MGRLQTKLSLKARALQWLAQRDQSRVELRRKLLRHASRVAGESQAGEDDGPTQRDEVEAVLDWLEAHRYLSAERFAEQRIHARELRFGNLRIKGELARHGVPLSDAAARTLAETELQRAAVVRQRRFSMAPCDATERAAQSRFLAARGFSPEVIHRLMRQMRASDRGAGEGDLDETA